MANRTYNALSPRNAYQIAQSQPPIVDWSDFPDEAQERQVDWSDFPGEEPAPVEAVQPEKEKNPYADTYENVPWLDPKNNDPFKPKSYDMLGTNLANEPPETPSLSGSMYGDSSFNYKPDFAFGVKPGNFEGIQSTNPDDYEQSDPEFSLRDLFTGENVIRQSGPLLGGIIGGAIGGGTGLLGGPAAPGTVPLGAKVGQSAGSAAGTLITDPIANWYAGKPQDWRSTLFEAGVNAAVGPLGKGLQGTSARKILANAVEQSTIGSIEGLVNAPARKMIRDKAIWDKTGNLNLPGANEWIGSGATGAGLGFGFGLAHGVGARGYQAYRAARNPLFTGNIPGGTKTVDPNYVPPSNPRPADVPFDDTPTYTYNGPESNQLPPGPKGADELITLKNPDIASIEAWRNQGYVMVDRSPEGYFQMARKDVAHKYIKEPTVDTPAENAFVYTDPNFNKGGAGDAELAGSTPYGEAPQKNVLEGEILPPDPFDVGTPPPGDAGRGAIGDPVITVPNNDPSITARLKEQGYVSIPGLVDKNGQPMMVRGDLATMYARSGEITNPTEGPGSPGWKDDITSSEGDIQRALDSAGPIVADVPPVQRVGNQAEVDKNEDWARSQRNLSVYEGKTDPIIKASYDKMQEVRNAYAEWISQQEEQLGPGQIFTPPPEVREAYNAQMEQMEDAHQAVINSRGGFEQGRPADIEGQATPVTPTVQLPKGFTPPPPQDPFIQDLKARMKYLDGRKAPDASYKALASKINPAPLKGRETWRSRLAKGIREAEKGPGKIEKGGPGSADVSNTYTQLERMLGRPPTTEEMDAAAARQAGVGDQTGQVAQFPEPLGQMAHRLVQEEAANPAPYFALDRTKEFAERVGQINSTDELDKLTLELRAGIENARQSGMSPESRIAYYDLMGILNARRVVLSKAGVSQLDKTLQGFSQPGGNINVRAPGKDGNVEWPPKSGTVQQPTYQPTEVYEQPGLPFGPVAANPNPPPMGIGDMRAQNGVQNITSADPNQLEIPFPVGPQQENGPGSAAVNKAYLEFVQREGREPTDDELVNITWGADSEKNVTPGFGPTTPTGMMGAHPIDPSSYGPKGQAHLQWMKDSNNWRDLDKMSVFERIEFDHFLKSLDWEEDPNQMPAVRPGDVNVAVRNTKMDNSQVLGWANTPIFPSEERNVGRNQGSEGFIKAGESVEVSNPETGQSWWEDRLNGDRLTDINNRLASGELELVDRSGPGTLVHPSAPPTPPEVPIPAVARVQSAITDISELENLDDLNLTDDTKVIIRATMDRINDTKTVNETKQMVDDLDAETERAIDDGDRESSEIYSELAHYAARRVVKMSADSVAKLPIDSDIAARLTNDQLVIFRASMDKIDAADTVAKAQANYNDLLKMWEGLTTSHPRLAHVANHLANYAANKLTQLEKEAAGVGPEVPIQSADMPLSHEPTFRRSIAKPGEQQDLPEMGLKEKEPFDVAKAIAEWEDAQDVPGFYKLGDRKKIVDPDTGMTEEDLVDQRAIIHNMEQDAIHGITEGDFTPEFLEKFPHLKGQFGRVIGWNPGAVSITTKDGRGVIVSREDITTKLPSERSHVSHKGVMNPDRFDKNGKFIGSASKEVDWSDFPEQEPLPLSHDIGLGNKKMGPGAMTRDEGSSMDLWNQLEEKLGRKPTGEEYLAELYKEDMSKAPRTLAGKKERAKEIERIMRDGFTVADTAKQTAFITPNGTRLAKPDRLIHAQALRDIGLKHDEVLKSGVIRVSGSTTETRGPITIRQAREVLNLRVQRGDAAAFIDVVLPDGETVGKPHDERMTPEALATWVNSHFPNEGMMRGEQQILPGFKPEDIRRKDVADPEVEIFKAPSWYDKLPFDHPIVAKFIEGLPLTKIPREARFITPEGDMLGKLPKEMDNHENIAQALGTTVDEALQAGMIRTRNGTAEIQAPITIAQARQLVDMRTYLKNYEISIDVTKPGQNGMPYASREFTERSKASSIYNWVNTMVKDMRETLKRFEEGWNEKGEGGTSTGAIFGGMPFGRAWRGVRNAARGAGWGQGGVNPASRTNPPATPPAPPAPYSTLDEAMQVPRHAMTAGDVSFLKRQGAGMITRPEYWKAVMEIPMSARQAGFDAIDARNRASIIYQHPVGAPTRRHPNGAPLPSLADDMGIELFTLASGNQIGPRAQAVASRWLEELPGPVGKMYRVSSRMHTTFLNTVKTNVAENMARNLVAMSGDAIQRITQQGGGTTGVRAGLRTQQMTAQEAFELNPFANPVFAREIGDWINTATGSGPLKTHIVWHKDYESNLENYANALNRTMFASGLSASHVRMLNPGTYVMASPFVRKQYMRSALGQAAAWFTSMLVNKLGADALGIDNEISFNVTSSDFGKNRMGNVRLDPGQGLLQFLVLYGRHWYGGHTTASSDEFKRFGEEYRGDTHGFNFFRFMTNKTEPMLKFAIDLATADKNNPFHVGDRIIQLAVPLFFQDVVEIAKEEPWLLVPFGIQAAIGDGTQIYERNESRAKFIPKEYDYVYEGNEGLQKMMPWNWGEKDPNQLPEPYKGKWR